MYERLASGFYLYIYIYMCFVFLFYLFCFILLASWLHALTKKRYKYDLAWVKKW